MCRTGCDRCLGRLLVSNLSSKRNGFSRDGRATSRDANFFVSLASFNSETAAAVGPVDISARFVESRYHLAPSTDEERIGSLQRRSRASCSRRASRMAAGA